MTATASATAASYLKISTELKCQVVPEFQACLNGSTRACTISTKLDDKQLIALAATLPTSPVEELCFSSLALPPNAWIALADACSKCRALKKLTLKQCTLVDGRGSSASLLAQALGGCRVKLLDISGMQQLGDASASALAATPMLSSGSDHLAVLRLSACGLGDDGACALAAALSAQGMHASLKLLDLTYSRVGDRGAAALATMLLGDGGSVPLQVLELEGNAISDAGGAGLWAATRSAVVLARLNLSGNRLGEAAVAAAADCIKLSAGTLKEVAMTGCVASDKVAAALLTSASRNATLTLLDVRGMALGPLAMQALCHLLATTTSLHTLCVDAASAQRAEEVCRCLEDNESLCHLSLSGPPVPELLAAAIAARLEANSKRRAAGVPPAPKARAASSSDSQLEALPPLHSDVSPRAAPQPAAKPLQGGRSASAPRASRDSVTNSTSTDGQQRRSSVGGRHRRSSVRAISSSLSSPARTLTAGAAAKVGAQMFRRHDVNGNNVLERSELLEALRELGMVPAGLSSKQVARLVEAEHRKADVDQDGVVGLQDFVRWYDFVAHQAAAAQREVRLTAAATRVKALVPLAAARRSPGLKALFRRYCRLPLGAGMRYTDEEMQMTGQQFVRLFQDVALCEPEGPGSGPLSCVTLNTIAMFCRKGASRLGFEPWLEALGHVALEMGSSWADLLATLQVEEEGALGGAEAAAGAGAARSNSSSDASHRLGDDLAPAFCHDGSLHSVLTVEAGQRVQAAAMQRGAAGKPAGGSLLDALQQVAGMEEADGFGKPSAWDALQSQDKLANPVFEAALQANMVSSSWEHTRASSEAAAAIKGSPARADYSALAARLAELEAAAAADRSRVSRLAAQLDIVQGRLKAAESEVQGLRSAGGSAQLGAERVLGELGSLKDSMADISAQVAEHSSGQVVAEATRALEGKLVERMERGQSRMESALMQVARQVDSLDGALREEQATTLKALEAILAQSQVADKEAMLAQLRAVR